MPNALPPDAPRKPPTAPPLITLPPPRDPPILATAVPPESWPVRKSIFGFEFTQNPIKSAMIIVTICWPLAIGGCGVLGCVTSGDGDVTRYETGRKGIYWTESGDTITDDELSERWAAAKTGGFMGGLCCGGTFWTLIYVAAMVTLIVMNSAPPRDG